MDMMKNKGGKSNSNKGKELKVILTILLILFAVISINLINGNIQKLTGIVGEKAQKLPASNGNIGGAYSNNQENNLLNSYQIMYFHGIPANEMTLTYAKQIKDAGFTTVQLLHRSWTISEVERDMDTALKNLQVYGLNAIVGDVRIGEQIGYFNPNASKYNGTYNENLAKENLRSAVEFYSKYPNVVGYNITDERSYSGLADLPSTIKLINYLYEIDPQRPGFINMLPFPYSAQMASEMAARGNNYRKLYVKISYRYCFF